MHLMIRTFDDATLAAMADYSKIPIINGLTDNFHQCQSLADLMTLKEQFHSFDNLKIAYIGDGNNILHSLLIMASKLGVTVNYCCPPGHQPKSFVLDMLPEDHASASFESPQAAVKGCHAVYTDVWTSMGFDEKDSGDFSGFQVNKTLMDQAAKDSVFMHCMPMNRGEEVCDELPDDECSVIFQQSENRMHVQQALLYTLLNEESPLC